MTNSQLRPFVYIVVHFGGDMPMQTAGITHCASEDQFFRRLAAWNAEPANAYFKYSAAVPVTEAQAALTKRGLVYADVKE